MRPRTMRVLLCGIAVCLLFMLTAWSVASAGERQASGPTATVKGATINVRGGPGTNYPIIGSAKKGH